MAFDPAKLGDNPLSLHPELAELQRAAEARAAVITGAQEPPPEASVDGTTPQGHNRPSSKYQDPQKLAEGYDHQFAETQRIIAERDAERQRAQTFEALLTVQMAQPKPPVAPAQDAAKPLDIAALVEAGIPVDQLFEFVQQSVGKVLAPFTAGITAREHLAQLYPDLPSNDDNLQRFLAANPNVQARFNIKKGADGSGIEDAYEYAYLAFKAANPTVAPHDEPGKESLSGKREQADARRDAENLAAGGSRFTDDPQNESAAALQRAYEAAKETGFAPRTPEMTHYLRLRFAGTSVAPPAIQR